MIWKWMPLPVFVAVLVCEVSCLTMLGTLLLFDVESWQYATVAIIGVVSSIGAIYFADRQVGKE